MRVEYINPFIVAIKEVLGSSVELTLTRSNLGIKEDNLPTHDVSAIIGLSGNAYGSVVLSFPRETAQNVVAKMLGDDEVTSEMIADAVGELTNMVAGRAKSLLAREGIKTYISIPRVILGTGHFILRPKEVPCVAVEFNTEAGNVALEVALKVLQQTPASTTG